MSDRMAKAEAAELATVERSFATNLVRRVGRILRDYQPRPRLDTQLVPILQFNYWTMRASEHMLERARRAGWDWRPHTKTEYAIDDYFEKHLEEERGHDSWLLKDLKDNGYFEGNCPLIAASLIGTVMYSIEFIDPCALLGWQIIGECFSLSEGELCMLEAHWGKTLLRTIRYHATHDKTHAAELMAVIDLLDARRFEIVERTALATARMFAAAMMEIAGG